MDVKTNFLNEDLKELMYVTQPKLSKRKEKRIEFMCYTRLCMGYARHPEHGM